MSAPVGNTCPDIDAIIHSMKEVHGVLESFYDEYNGLLDHTRLKQVYDAMSSIEPLFSRGFNPLEDLRSANYDLRQWGELNEEKIQELQSEIEELHDKINELTTL